VRISPRAGRLPNAGAALAIVFSIVLLCGSARWAVAATNFNFWAALASLCCGLALTFYRVRRVAWRCPHCGLHQRARLRHAGPLSAVVAVPAYNNAGSLVAVVRDIRRMAPELPVIVINDGSTDSTETELARSGLLSQAEPRVWLVTHPRNLGKGAAIKTALAHALQAGFSHLVTFDADGQHLAQELPKMLEAAHEHPTAIIIGARDLSSPAVSNVSRFGRAFSNFWLRIQTGCRLEDSQSGLRVYPVAPAHSLGARGRRYDFEVEILILAGRAGLEMRSVPISVHYPPPAQRVTHFRAFVDNARISFVNTRLLVLAPLWPLGWPARLSGEPAPAAVPRAWSGKSRGGRLGHAIFLLLLKSAGQRAAYALTYPVAFYFCVAAPAILRRSRAFLAIAAGPAGSRWRAFWRSYRHFLMFAQTLVDKAFGQLRGPGALKWTSTGTEYVTEPSQSGHGALLVSAHVGNYELAGICYSDYRLPIAVVMLDAEAHAVKKAYARLDKSAKAWTPEIIATNRSEFPALKVLAALRAGKTVALHGDRIIDHHWVWCDFLGTRAAFPTGVFVLAAAARVPVVLTFGFKTARDQYAFIAEPPRMIELPHPHRDEALARHAQWYASRLEHYVRQYPLQWFNFYDFFAPPVTLYPPHEPR